MTRNYGLEKAKGEWIAFLDDDDFYLENKIEAQLSCMKINPYSVLIPPGGVLEFLKITRFINIMSFIA
jgi:glycosyltransferase involved in cell wall biosynthesis